MLTRDERIDLVMRMLGLRHKLKVHDSMKAAETHEELSVSLMSRWEIEDEIAAIESILADDRRGTVDKKRKELLDGKVKKRSVK